MISFRSTRAGILGCGRNRIVDVCLINLFFFSISFFPSPGAKTCGELAS